MERPREFSIEPYIDQGGILGAQLEVNEKTASSVMRRTALRRDVLVTKGYGRATNNVVGSSELAIVRSRSVFAKKEIEETLSISTLSKTPTDWIIMINDQQLHERVDDWMSKHFKAGEGESGNVVYDRRFVKDLNNVVVGRKVREAFWDEKRKVAAMSLINTLINDSLPVSKAAFITYSFISLVRLHFIEDSSSFRDLLTVIKNIFLLTAAGIPPFMIGRLLDGKYQDGYLLNNWENIIPNFQIPSIVAGNVSLSLNGNKLIRLKS